MTQSTRSAAELAWLMPRLGSDLLLDYGSSAGAFEDADLVARTSEGRFPRARDLAVARDLASAEQLLVNRIKTQKGELAPLGHPEYGSRHHELLGQPNVPRTRNLIKLHILEALSHEPRVQKVERCEVVTGAGVPRDQVRIELELRLIDRPNPLNLVVPFSLEVPL